MPILPQNGDMTKHYGLFAGLCSVRQVFVEANTVSKRVSHLNHQAVVKRLLDARSHVAVAARSDCRVEFFDAVYPNKYGGARTAVAVMFGQMQNEILLADLQIHR